MRIDRLALDSITSHPHDRAIVRAVIGLVREVGLMVTADGVETAPQADALVALGCVRHQGHYYAPPMPVDDFIHFLGAANGIEHFGQIIAEVPVVDTPVVSPPRRDNS